MPPDLHDAPFGTNVRVSETDTPGNQNEITMALASDGRLHMGWNDYRQPNSFYRCGYAYSTDGGQTWSANRLFHQAAWQASGDPVVTVDANDNVHFICLSFDYGGGSVIVVYTSTDGGATFAPAVNASDTTTGFNDKPWALATGTTLHACYTNFVGGTELRYTRSVDGGATFAPTRVLDFNGQGCTFAWDGLRLYLAWTRGTAVFALRSADQGVTWSSPVAVGSAVWTSDPEQRAYNMPSMAADPANGNAYLVWTANDGLGWWDVFFSRSTNGGVTWSPRIPVNDVRTNHQFMPAVSVDGTGRVHVLWYDRDPPTGAMQVRYASSTDAGVSWSASLRVTDTSWTATCSGPDCPVFIGDYIALLADSAGTVHAGWSDRRSGENEAYFATTAGGAPRLSRIEVSPLEAWTDADTPVSFSASGYDQYGQPYPVNPTWEAERGAVSGGLYTPGPAGDWRVWANESGVSGSAIAHVSPGALVRIRVDPVDVTITADDAQQYIATGYDAKGNIVGLSPTWGVSDGSISAGLFIPRRTGLWTVYANASGVVGWTSVTVTSGVLATLTVSPPLAMITTDDAQQFAASGADAKGNEVPISPLWTAGGGTIDGTGLYVASLVGTWAVYATDSGVSGSAQIIVSHGALAWIEVTPDDVTITADDAQQYSATGYDAKGNLVSVTPAWSVTAGAITSSGLYTPTPAGTFVVTASEGAISGFASVTVVPGRLARIDVVPPASTITADDVLQLAAFGYDGKGNPVEVSPLWESECGTVGASGLYAPGPARLCVVYANETAVSGSAAVTVVPGRLARIEISPPLATITADDVVSFAARGFDARGNEVAVAPAWFVSEGVIDPSGVYTPRHVGVWEVRAASVGVGATASVTVLPGVLAVIDLDPPVAFITADESVGFIATGRDAKGNEIPVSAPIWSSEDGTIADGVLVPNRVGTWGVSAAQGGVEGTARVTVRPGAVARVVVEPGDAHVTEGAVAAFSARAYDAKGNLVPDAVIAWRVSGSIGTVDGSGTFRATRAGQGQVIATASDGLASADGSAAVLVDAGLLAYLPWLFVLVAVPVAIAAWMWRRRRAHPPPVN